MFALSTALLGMDIADLVVCLQTDRWTFSPSPTAEQQMLAFVAARDKLIFYAKPLFELEFLVGDALIVWRVLVLYKSQRFATCLKLVLGALWLSAVVLVARETTCWVESLPTPSDPPLCTTLRQAAWGVSLVLNSLASAFIWRVIRQRRAMLRSMAAFPGQHEGKTRVDRVLYILLISSTVYIAFGLLAVFLTLHAGSTIIDGVKETAYIATLVSDQIVGIYPSVVTIFVLNQETIFGPLSSSPTFARNETTTTILFNPNVTMRSAPGAQRTIALSAIPDEEAGEPGLETIRDDCHGSAEN
ncbi:hypothetical protein AURDEDRAFT_170739 [Auricularia subglabra TFB-10046 SS5]|uniref:G-protein coupled receptors family 1 profile domain-containing protein n=1 Tax=Auricularia subglabra (strain TFB-10046 / SS5) TaxID=717982 RepID=J0WXV9_AURST|nr:hypothetical protein AURDEDRAFT_170739 [Auricularia subglabra TFB-10046 SS5]